ncbi:hypothetical protein BU26DRAFT_351843 [Trematosphaeria pertusa]|uniref:Uncharacterized protein n=1 Tax=Trematosphaeria pertusa TaxID=390896 RepID=A0A6A6IDP0_9PLEO|nr:uncharacterized protein BU26DRAFT_351843 [Trematosphaeria pertusa]KAF2247680.1 hypothetical protein BU26DRAFT_351843 [Trematosphaeria pertusa]
MSLVGVVAAFPHPRPASRSCGAVSHASSPWTPTASSAAPLWHLCMRLLIAASKYAVKQQYAVGRVAPKESPFREDVSRERLLQRAIYEWQILTEYWKAHHISTADLSSDDQNKRSAISPSEGSSMQLTCE